VDDPGVGEARRDAPRPLDGKAVAKSIREEVAAGCADLARDRGVVPGLTVVLVGENPASQIYVRNKEKAARDVGMRSAVRRLAASTEERELLEVVRGLNADPAVHGILVQLPLPSGIDESKVLLAIDPRKDVARTAAGSSRGSRASCPARRPG
jgi:methylenetetrahydrofolate dehydrogenase (NADP+)/methenyltetrahydrofolate cyclohydrolase